MPVLEKKLQTRVKAAAKKLGLEEREVLNRAVSLYLAELNEFQNLKEELRLWDVLSAKTMQKYKF